MFYTEGRSLATAGDWVDRPPGQSRATFFLRAHLTHAGDHLSGKWSLVPGDVQTFLGHSTLTMAMKIYTRATESGTRSAISALPFANVSATARVVSTQDVPNVCASRKTILNPLQSQQLSRPLVERGAVVPLCARNSSGLVLGRGRSGLANVQPPADDL